MLIKNTLTYITKYFSLFLYKMENLTQRIEEIMSEKQLFRSPDITIQDLAVELATNRFYVSRAINKDFGMSFTQYMNLKRIEFSIQLMKLHPRMKMDEVATECGFVSEKAFFRKFKEIKGDSPRAYVNRDQED